MHRPKEKNVRKSQFLPEEALRRRRIMIKPDKYVSPFSVRPPHSLPCGSNCETLKSIMESMKAKGWIDRPLVVVEMERKSRWDFWALTGSHRVVCARKNNLKIPVIILPNGFVPVLKGYYTEIYEDAIDYFEHKDQKYNWGKFQKAAKVLSIEEF